MVNKKESLKLHLTQILKLKNATRNKHKRL